MTSALGVTVKDVANFAQNLNKKIDFLDAPVSGGIAGAASATLTIMVGGHKSILEKCRPVLDALGKKIFYTGDLGSGKDVKMINQLLNAGNTYVAAEALYLAKHLGLDMDLLCNIIDESTGSSWVFKYNVPKFMLSKKYGQGFRLELMKKDLGLSMNQAQKDQISLPIMNHIYQIYQSCVNQGKGNMNYNVISEWISDQN